MLPGIGAMPWTTRLAFGAIVSRFALTAVAVRPPSAGASCCIGAQAHSASTEARFKARAAIEQSCMVAASSGIANVGDRRGAKIGAPEVGDDARPRVAARGQLPRFLEANEVALLREAFAVGAAQLHLHVGID